MGGGVGAGSNIGVKKVTVLGSSAFSECHDRWRVSFCRLSSSNRKLRTDGIRSASFISSRLYPGPWVCWKTSKTEWPLLLIRRPRTSSWQGERVDVLSVSVPMMKFGLAMLSKVGSSKVARRRSADVVATVVTVRLGCAGCCIEPGMCGAAPSAVYGRG